MASEATIKRRREKEQWMAARPAYHEWLRQQSAVSLTQWTKHPMARAMVAELKALGFYNQTTVAVDVCAAMRRFALQFDPATPAATAEAQAEIECILSRKGVDRDLIVKQLRP